MLTQPLSTRILRQATPPLAYLVSLRTVDEVLLDDTQRALAAATVDRLCNERHWQLHALSVRPGLLQAVVGADVAPERVTNALRAGTVRLLGERGLLKIGAPLWARQTSTRYVWSQQRLREIAAWVRDQDAAAEERQQQRSLLRRLAR